MSKFSVAVVGATGAVGRTMVKVLEERNFPIKQLRLFASERSAGSRIDFAGEQIPVETLQASAFKGIDIALFSAGGAISKEFAPIAAKSGAVVIDNTSAFRLEADVPLIVPEVNRHALADFNKRGIVANPNCTTIQLVVALAPLARRFGLRRVVVASYQAVSGAGRRAIAELQEQSQAVLDNSQVPQPQVIARQIAFNCVPQIGSFDPLGYTTEENKVVNETRKILEDSSIGVAVLAVRVPVFVSHAEAVFAELKQDFTLAEVLNAWRSAEGVVLAEEQASFPVQIDAAGRDEVFVGRVRRDFSVPYGIAFWCVADNLRKGAATNAVQIAEHLVKKYL